MATTGPLTVDCKEYGTAYEDGTASPGYYAVTLDKYGVRASADHAAHLGRALHVSRSNP